MSDDPRTHNAQAPNCITAWESPVYDPHAVCRTCADDEARREAGLDVQPDPVPTDQESSHDKAIAEMERRKAFGLEKYGNTLTAGNGRNSVQDVVDELADALVYAITERTEREALAVALVAVDVALEGDGPWSLQHQDALIDLQTAVGKYLGRS